MIPGSQGSQACLSFPLLPWPRGRLGCVEGTLSSICHQQSLAVDSPGLRAAASRFWKWTRKGRYAAQGSFWRPRGPQAGLAAPPEASVRGRKG